MNMFAKNTKRLVEKRQYHIILILACMLTVFTVIAGELIYEKIVTFGSGSTVIATSVSLGGKKFTKDSPLKVLEIVPNECADEIGYMMGKDSGAVRWSDIAKLPTTTTDQAAVKKSVRDQWVNVVVNLDGGSNYVRVQLKKQADTDTDANWHEYFSNTTSFTDSDYSNATMRIQYFANGQWTTYTYNTTSTGTVYADNLFAYGIFKGYDMCDKMQIDVKAATDVTADMISGYDLVYINGGAHVSTTSKDLYQAMYTASQNVQGLSKVYQNVSAVSLQTSANNFTANKVDLKADVAWQIFYSAETKKCSLMIDNNIRVGTDTTTNGLTILDTYNNNTGYNLGKLYVLITGIARDTFLQGFATSMDNTHGNTTYGRYVGNLGSIDPTTLKLYFSKTTDAYGNARNPLTPVNWSAQMFAWSPYSTGPTDVYYNAGSWGSGASTFINQNIYVYNGDNSVGVSFMTGADTLKGNGTYAPGTTSEQAVSMYGDAGSGSLPYTQMIKYIVGGYAEYREVTHINVLEIEPSSDYKYNSWEGAQKIRDYFGVAFKGMDNTNYTNYISVTSVSMNAFIGMTDDIYDCYDLIILSDNNDPAEYIKTSNTNVYSAYGEKMSLVTAPQSPANGAVSMSGNDLTQKALGKIVDYVQKGKPIVLANSIYNANSAFPTIVGTNISQDTKVYYLSKTQLKTRYGIDTAKANILSEPDWGSASTAYTKLKYCFSPQLSVDSQYKCTYTGNNDDIADASFTKAQLSDFTFSGTIGTLANTDYNLKVYFDKDGNGLYTQSNDEDNELYYNAVVTTGANGSFNIHMNLPSGMRGYIRWKTVATDIVSGYSSEDVGAIVVKYDNSEIRTVKVLQIVPVSSNTKTINDSAVNLLMNGTKFQSLFGATSSVTGLKLDVTAITTYQFAAWYNGINYQAGGTDYDNQNKNKLYGYSMVVIGFGDSFNGSDITNTSALNNLQDYINKGNSVLFSHDTILYSAYSDGTVNNQQYKKADSYKLTSGLRALLGMDKYGVSLSHTGLKYQQGFTNLFLMKYATYNGSTYPEYAGMSSNVVGTNTQSTTNTVDKLNKGQITEYPYQIPQTLSVATTHAQWFQLNLESQSTSGSNDAVVWYTLGQSQSQNCVTRGAWSQTSVGSGGWNTQSYATGSNTAANADGTAVNGTIPEKGSFIEYTARDTGTLSLTVKLPANATFYIVADNSEVTKGNTYTQYSVSRAQTATVTINAVAGHTYYAYTANGTTSISKISYPGNDMSISDILNSNAGSKYYGLAGDDALNNYYIYSKGNVTYSGAGHSVMNQDSELKLFVNTVVRAIASGNNAPSVTVNSGVSIGQNNYEQYVRNADSVTPQSDDVTFTVQDVDMGTSTSAAFTSGMMYWDIDNDGVYTEGTDVPLVNYNTGNVIYNLTPTTVTLGFANDANRTCTCVYKDSNGKTQTVTLDKSYAYIDSTGKQQTASFRDYLDENKLTLGIMVYDSKKQSGQAFVNLIRRELFKLD